MRLAAGPSGRRAFPDPLGRGLNGTESEPRTVMHSLPLRAMLVTILLIAGARLGSAQQTNFVGNRYEPLNQYAPPGTVSQWAIQAGRICPQFVQQVRIHLPTEGTLTGYNGAPQNVVRLA